MAMVFRLGGITFDDVSLLKVLTLPSNARGSVPVTFHDSANNDFKVPIGKKFIVGKIFCSLSNSLATGRVGGSDSVDTYLTAEGLTLGVEIPNTFFGFDVLAAIPAEKYVTGMSNDPNIELKKGTAVYGILINE